MALTLSSWPNRDLNGVESPLFIQFNVLAADLEATPAAPAIVTIDAAEFASVQDGTEIWVNGLKFTYGPGASSATTNSLNTGAGIAATTGVFPLNIYLARHYDPIQIAGVGLEMTPIRAGQDTVFEFRNLSGAFPAKTFTFSGTALRVKDNYHVLVSIFDSATDVELLQFRVFASVVLNEAQDTILSWTIEKDFNQLVKQLVEPYLPPLQIAGLFPTVATDIMTRDVYYKFGEASGTPLNQFALIEPPFVITKLYAGGFTKRENVNGLNDYTTPGAALMVEEEGETIYTVCNQEHYIWAYVDNPTGANLLCSITVTLISGATFINNVLFGGPAPAGEEHIAGLFSGPAQLDGIMNLFGLDPGDIRSYTLTMTVDGQVVTRNFEVIDTQCACVLHFRTKIGTYTSIPVQCLESQSFTTVQEYITVCETENQTVADHREQGINSDIEIELSFRLFDERYYQQRVLEELFLSQDVYMDLDGQYYALVPDNDGADISQKNERTVIEYGAKMHLYYKD